MKLHNYILLAIVLNIPMLGIGQGCSDAGFCTMGSMRPNQHIPHTSKVTLRSVEWTQYTAVADFKSEANKAFYDYFLSYIMDANVSVGRRMGLQLKIPYNMVFGTLANTQGIGDVSWSGTYLIKQWNDKQWQITLGGKVPTGTPDRSINKNGQALPLPMYYQPTLGTFDLVAGTSLVSRGWLLATGMQWAARALGSSEFLWGKWKRYSPEDTIFTDVYPRANKLQRGFDIMFRIEKNLRFSNWNIFTGLLPIYRLTEDTFINPAGVRVGDPDSKGLALTYLVGGGYRISAHSAIKCMVGYRLLGRKQNPDGLKRLAVATLSYEYRF